MRRIIITVTVKSALQRMDAPERAVGEPRAGADRRGTTLNTESE